MVGPACRVSADGNGRWQTVLSAIIPLPSAMTSSRANVLQVRGFVVLLALTTVLAQESPKPRNAIVFVADGLRHGVRQCHRHAGVLQSPDPGRVFRQQPFGLSDADDAEFGGYCDRPLSRRHRPVRQSDLHRLSAFRSRQFRPRARHDGARRRGSDRARQTSTITSAATICAKPRCSRSRGHTAATRPRSARPAPPRCRISSDVAAGSRRAARPDHDHHRRCGRRTRRRAVERADAPESPGLRPRRRRGLATGTTRRAERLEQQQWFADAATKAILPAFAKSPEPFLLVFWSGDPDERNTPRATA